MEKETQDFHEGLSGKCSEMSEETASNILDVFAFITSDYKRTNVEIEKSFEELAKSFEEVSQRLKLLHSATGKFLILRIRYSKGLKRLYYVWKLKQFRKKTII